MIIKKKILFILPTLTAGGAERVISFVSQNIDPERFESTLLIAGYKKNAAYDIKNINVHFLEKKRVLKAIPQIFLFILKNKPNTVMTTIGHLNISIGLMAPFFSKTKFIIREASVISYFSKHNKNKRSKLVKIYSFLSHIAYKNIDKIVCQSKDMADDFIDIYNISPKTIAIINNPITKDLPAKQDNFIMNNVKKFITVGRLSKEKGHIRILKILSRLSIPFHYTIIGEGPYKNEIFEMIDKLNLKDKISYIPFTTEVSKYISLNNYFLQGSYVEGFPNTLLESCIVGTPVIAFNVPGGTKEIIIHKENGFLVKTEESYFDALNSSFEFSTKTVSNSVRLKFSKNKIINQYEELFSK